MADLQPVQLRRTRGSYHRGRSDSIWSFTDLQRDLELFASIVAMLKYYVEGLIGAFFFQRGLTTGQYVSLWGCLSVGIWVLLILQLRELHKQVAESNRMRKLEVELPIVTERTRARTPALDRALYMKFSDDGFLLKVDDSLPSEIRDHVFASLRSLCRIVYTSATKG
jgi:hypothetical protein